jgi:hypothetical protein
MTVDHAKWPNYREGDFVIRNYVFRSGERLPELNLHYRTLGTKPIPEFSKVGIYLYLGLSPSQRLFVLKGWPIASQRDETLRGNVPNRHPA